MLPEGPLFAVGIGIVLPLWISMFLVRRAFPGKR